MKRTTTRRGFIKTLSAGTASFGTTMAIGSAPPPATRDAHSEPDTPVRIGTRRELFIDDFLITRLEGATRQLHHPTPRDVVLTHDAPWEGSGCGYHSVFQDGALYRLFYKAWHLDVSSGKLVSNAHPLYCCYAESDDGTRWRKPNLGLHEFRGSKANNIVMTSGKIGAVDVDAGHPAVFKDDNPQAAAEARYKAFFRSAGPRGLLAFQSPDAIHWSPMTDHPVITDGAFDSQNLACWDPVRAEYRAFWRIFTAGITTEKQWQPKGYRAIRTATSKDFLHWGPHADLQYKDSPPEHLYTNQIKPYYRAPHIFIGFPTRYVERGWSDSMRALPELEHRQLRAKASLRYGTALTEGLVMSSRDGVRFQRWNEAFLRPGIQREGTWQYGQQYIAWQLVETKSALRGAPNELSLYAPESYWTGNSSRLRRFTLRIDGFVSVSAPFSGGTLVTRPVVFDGKRLTLNFSTSAAGSIRVELQRPDGKPIPGFALADSHEVFGDELERTVTWRVGKDLAQVAGQPIRMRFEMRDADLYSLRFVENDDS